MEENIKKRLVRIRRLALIDGLLLTLLAVGSLISNNSVSPYVLFTLAMAGFLLISVEINAILKSK